MHDLSQAKRLIRECLETQSTFLDLGNCGITNLGDLPELFECTQLETLNLSGGSYDYLKEEEFTSQNTGSHNNIKYLTKDIKNLNRLRCLIIGESNNFKLNSITNKENIIIDIIYINKLQELEILKLIGYKTSNISFCKKLENLEALDLNTNLISNLGPIRTLGTLKFLNLNHNKVTAISPLRNLKNLNYLRLSNNRISDIKQLKYLTKLTELNLSSNQISELEPLKNLNALTFLDLHNNQISDIKALKEINGLTYLELRSNRISDLEPLKNLNTLTYLYLDKNQISNIEPLKDLTELTDLDLRLNQVSNLNPLKHLKKLKSIDLQSNNVSDLNSLKYLKELKSLNLRSNQVSDLNPLKHLKNLKSINLKSNNVSELGPLKDLKGLNFIGLDSNSISDLEPLKYLKDLITISLNSNNISKLGPLKKLKNLSQLQLKSNQISDLEPLRELTGLRILYLNSNKISKLPSWITDFKAEIGSNEFSSGISLYDNPLTTPPPETVEQGKAAIKRYFEELSKEDIEEVPLFEAKVLLLGEGKTGKTSLRYKLEDEDKPLPSDEDRTRGVDIYDHKFPTSKDNFISHIWDFGGQDILYQAHRFFLSDDALYILVTDSRADQGNKYEEWLQTIEIFTERDDNPILLLQNLKHGDTPANIDIAEYRSLYSIVRHQVYNVDLSFSTPEHLENFRELKKAIEHCLVELPHVRKPILSHQLAIRKELETLLYQKNNLIRFSEYRKICATHTLDNGQAQKDLLKYLHKLGIVLWYGDYPAISRTIVLNPEWVTTALYRIIDSKSIREKNGKLEQSDVEALWSEAEYEDYHNELLELLQIFRLAYKRKNENAYIVPSLMNTKIPENHEKWNPAEQWTIRYKYPRLMPRGIVNQLAAELCSYVESDFEDVWAFGVVFTAPNAKAKVQVNRSRKEIVVTTSGDDRLQLQQSIVKALQDIHSTYKGLEFDIEIPCNCHECAKRSAPDKTHYLYHKDIMLEINDGRDDIYCRNLRRPLSIEPILRDSGFALPYPLVELLKVKEKAFLVKKAGIMSNVKQISDRTKRIDDRIKQIDSRTERIEENTQEIMVALEGHFATLLQLSQAANTKNNLTEERIIAAVRDTSENQQEAILDEFLDALASQYSYMDEQLQNIYEDLNKPGGNTNIKLKAAIPFINLLGLDIGMETEFDVGKWTKEMYKKYELPLFKLFGYV